MGKQPIDLDLLPIRQLQRHKIYARVSKAEDVQIPKQCKSSICESPSSGRNSMHKFRTSNCLVCFFAAFFSKTPGKSEPGKHFRLDNAFFVLGECIEDHREQSSLDYPPYIRWQLRFSWRPFCST